jgi:16S rRNA (guanine966-N2)-methyltransferase
MVLDLFAGTGALGIESISRGAQRVIFIDTQKRAISVLQRNIDAFTLEKKATVIQWNILKNLNCLQSIDHVVDLVFMDPPYNQRLIEPSLINLHRSGCLASGAHLIVEHSQFEAMPLEAMPQTNLPFEIMDQRQYGKTLVSFLDYML